jgi:hypothetical protein
MDRLSRFLSARCGSGCYLRVLSFVIDGMKRAILTLLGLAGAAGLLIVGMHEVGVAGPVYSVAELRARLVHDPSAWVGHVVLVRGTVSGCGLGRLCPPIMAVQCATPVPCRPIGLPGMMLVDQPTASWLRGLPAQLGAQNPQLAFLRRLPLVSRVVPPPQVVRWGIPAVYRVQLQPAQPSVCRSSPCYEAVLQDAAPVVRVPSVRLPLVPPRPAPVVIHGATGTAQPRHLLPRPRAVSAWARTSGHRAE